jgi:acyl-CoA thioesterase I
MQALWRQWIQFGVTALMVLALVACGGRESAPLTSGPPAPAPADAKRIVVMGDSLSAAYGIAAEQGWVALLEQRLRAENRPWTFINASISGETSAGGATRIATVLDEHRPALVILELGANDGLRGLPVAEMRSNLERMAEATRARGARLLVVGMRMPPNYGLAYTQEFFATFEAVAKAHEAAYLPFLLEPLGLNRQHFQADNLHPTAEAQPLLAEHVWETLEPLLDE